MAYTNTNLAELKRFATKDSTLFPALLVLKNDGKIYAIIDNGTQYSLTQLAQSTDNSMAIKEFTTTITPEHNTIYKKTIATGDVYTIPTSALTANKSITFELWLDMPATVITPSLPANVTWINGTPALTTANTRYVLTIRWDGTKLIGNQSYQVSL